MCAVGTCERGCERANEKTTMPMFVCGRRLVLLVTLTEVAVAAAAAAIVTYMQFM